jgi:hypothetical protein
VCGEVWLWWTIAEVELDPALDLSPYELERKFS